MPRPTDVVFRNFNELTYIAPEDRIHRPLPTPTYPTRLLVNLIDESPEGSYEYWLLESGKTLRIFRPPSKPPPPLRTPLHERQHQCKRPPPLHLLNQNQQRQRQTRPPSTPAPTPTPQKQKWKMRWRRKSKSQKKPPSAFKAWIEKMAKAKAASERKARKEKMILMQQALTRFLPRVLTVNPIKLPNPIKLCKSYIKSRSKTVLTPPPISPYKSYCYPPLRSPSSPFSARLKFWKRKTAGEEETLEPGEMWTSKMFESGGIHIPLGVQFERWIWKIDRARRLALRRLSAKPSSMNEYLIDSDLDSENEAGDSFGTDIDQDNSTGNRSNRFTPLSCESTACSSFPFSPYSPRTRSSKPFHSRTYSPILTLPSIKETTETTSEPKPYRSLLPKSPPPSDPCLHQMALAFHRLQKEKAKTPPREYILCPIFNYQGNPNWDKHPLLILYFYIPFTAPWEFVELLKLIFCWVPFFGVLVNFIMDNGGGTFLFLMSHVAFAGAMLPAFVFFCIIVLPVCALHNWFVAGFRRMPFYRFKYSLGFPGIVEEVEQRDEY